MPFYNAKVDDAQIEDYIRALPKAELHLHLEGTVEPATLCELAGGHGLPQPADDLYRYPDFLGFLQAFKTVCEHLKTPRNYELITLRMIERLRRDGVVYAEVFVAPGIMLRKGESFPELFEGIRAGATEGRSRHGVEVRWILDATRNFGPESVRRVAELAVEHKSDGVIGLGIGGDEKSWPPELFAESYAYARDHGLRLTAHAGETAGPESMWSALRTLNAERLGHGVAADGDPDLVRHLAEHRIPVDLCPTSNVKTGAVARIADHPLRRFFDAGMLVSLATDDPAMFGCDLTGEYLLAHRQFHFTAEELAQLARNSFEASFLSAEEKSRYTT